MDSLTAIRWTSLLLCSTIIMAPTVQGENLGYPNRYGAMAEKMLDMMDAFSSAYRKHRTDGQLRDFTNSTGHQRMPGYLLPPADHWSPGKSPGPPGQYYRSRLDGNWQGKTGEILVIRSGRFRIYQSSERYHEGLVYLDAKHIALRQMTADVTHRFEYAEKRGRLVLRDSRGKLLLYQRIK